MRERIIEILQGTVIQTNHALPPRLRANHPHNKLIDTVLPGERSLELELHEGEEYQAL